MDTHLAQPASMVYISITHLLGGHLQYQLGLFRIHDNSPVFLLNNSGSNQVTMAEWVRALAF